MKTFSLEGKCEKCGGENIGIQYCAGSYRCSYKMRHLIDGEHMHRFCPRCHYEWAESCQAPDKERARDASADFAQTELRKRGLTFQDEESTPEQRREVEKEAQWMEAEEQVTKLSIENTELKAEVVALRGLLEDA